MLTLDSYNRLKKIPVVFGETNQARNLPNSIPNDGNCYLSELLDQVSGFLEQLLTKKNKILN